MKTPCAPSGHQDLNQLFVPPLQRRAVDADKHYNDFLFQIHDFHCDDYQLQSLAIEMSLKTLYEKVFIFKT